MTKKTQITADDLDLEIGFEKIEVKQENHITANDLDVDMSYKTSMNANQINEEETVEQSTVSAIESTQNQKNENANQVQQVFNEHSQEQTNEQALYEYAVNERLRKNNLKQKKWDERISPNFFDKSFFVRAMIAFAIYSSMFFIGYTMEHFWTPYVFLPVFEILFRGMFISIAAGNEELFMQLANIYFDNAIYFVLFIIIVPLFWKEIKASIKALWKKLWLIPLIPFVHFATLWVSMFVTTIASIFFTLPDTSQNQEAIESSMSVSTWANVFPTVVGAPFVEEIIFRGIVAALVFFITTKVLEKAVKSARKKYIVGAVVGTIVSAVFFGLIHVASRGDYLAIFPYIAMGLSFGVIYFATGRNLLYAILLHMYHNAFSILIFVLF